MYLIIKYKSFIKENVVEKEKILVPYKASNAFNTIVTMKMTGKISEMFKTYDRTGPYVELSLIDVETDDKVSYTPATKLVLQSNYNEYNLKHVDWTKDRFTIKIGRLVKKLFGDALSTKEIEDFVNLYKVMSKKDPLKGFDLVSGKDLNKYYSEKSYESQIGSLGSSCMKQDWKNDFMNFYSDNGVKLLILRGEGDTIKGRALVWELKDGKIFMDRAYTISDYYIETFKEYAKKQGWLYKQKQSSNTELLVVENGKNKILKMKYKLTNVPAINEALFPFADTFRFLNFKDKILYNYIEKDANNELSSTSGYLSSIDFEYVETYDGYIIPTECAVFSNLDEAYAEENDNKLLWLDYLEEYIISGYTKYKIVYNVEKGNYNNVYKLYFLEEDVNNVWLDSNKVLSKYMLKSNLKKPYNNLNNKYPYGEYKGEYYIQDLINMMNKKDKEYSKNEAYVQDMMSYSTSITKNFIKEPEKEIFEEPYDNDEDELDDVYVEFLTPYYDYIYNLPIVKNLSNITWKRLEDKRGFSFTIKNKEMQILSSEKDEIFLFDGFDMIPIKTVNELHIRI